MEYALIIVLVLVVATLAFVLMVIKRKTKSKVEDSLRFKGIVPKVSSSGEIIIPINQLPATVTIDNNKLFEITDSTVIARISDTIPGAAQTIAKTVANKALKNVELFKMDIPSSALAKSKEVKGAFRAFSRSKNEIRKNANLVKIDPTKVSKASAMANGVANVINVGSLVVGQYYMAEINSKIEAISRNIDKISEFQDREFKSRIFALIARVREISTFSAEILENDELRNRKLQTLDNLKGEGTQLLQQVNQKIDDTIKKNQKPDYKEYQGNVDSFCVLIEYQNILMSVLEENSKLTYLLEKGERTNEFCYSMFYTYLEQSNKVRTALDEWHQQQVGFLGIDIDKNRKNKTGVEGFFAAIPGLFDDKWKYKELTTGLGQKINAQKTTNQLMIGNPVDLYDNDVQIIIKDGKYFYLTGEENEH